MIRNRPSSALKVLSVVCALLLAAGAASAQKNKKSQITSPFGDAPPLPPPTLLNPATAPSALAPPTAQVSTSEQAPLADPAAATPAPSAAAAPTSDLTPSWVPGQPLPGSLTVASVAPVIPAPAAESAALVPVSTYAPSTGRTHSILSFDEYAHLLNVVLPVDHRSPPGLEYSVILRFEPHVHPESQIVIRRWRDGRIETALYRVDKVNAWRAAYGNVADGQTPDFVAMSKQITVVRNSFQVQTSDEAEWRKALLPTLQKELAKARKKAKHLDREGVHELETNGTRYELWYIQGDSEMHFVSYGNEIDAVTKGDDELTHWMNAVRSYADTHLTAYKPLRNSADETKPPRTLLSSKQK